MLLRIHTGVSFSFSSFSHFPLPVSPSYRVLFQHVKQYTFVCYASGRLCWVVVSAVVYADGVCTVVQGIVA